MTEGRGVRNGCCTSLVSRIRTRFVACQIGFGWDHASDETNCTVENVPVIQERELPMILDAMRPNKREVCPRRADIRRGCRR